MNAASNERSLLQVLADLARHPHEHLVRRWNWKSAVLSSLFRSSLFFAANFSAGPEAARAAFLTELAYRGVTAGFYGALTQAFRDARPAWAGTVAAMVLLPAVSHLLELVVHWVRGTPNLTESLALSVAFTALSTSFNLFAMRRGALTVGRNSGPLLGDLHRMPALMVAFAAAIVRTTIRGAARVVQACRPVRRVRRCTVPPDQACGGLAAVEPGAAHD